MRVHTITTAIVVFAVCALAIPASASADPGGGGYPGATAITPTLPEDESGSQRRPVVAADGLSAYISARVQEAASQQRPAPTSVAGSPSSPQGFEWESAAIGAGATLALLSLSGAALLTVRRRTAMSPS